MERTFKPLERFRKISLGMFSAFLVLCLIGASLWIRALQGKIRTIHLQLDESSKQVDDLRGQLQATTETNNAKAQLELARIDLQVLDIGVRASGHLSQLGSAINRLGHMTEASQLNMAQRKELEKDIQLLQNDAAQLRALRSQTASKIEPESPRVQSSPFWRSARLSALMLIGLSVVTVPVFTWFRLRRAGKKARAPQPA